MSSAFAFLAPPSTIGKLVARGPQRGRQYRRCGAVTPIAGRPSSFPNARGFSEEDKNGAVVGDDIKLPLKQDVLPEKMDMPELEALDVPEEGGSGIKPGKGAEVFVPPVPIAGRGATEGSKWLTFYTEDENRTPYYFNKETGETQWCAAAFCLHRIILIIKNYYGIVHAL